MFRIRHLQILILILILLILIQNRIKLRSKLIKDVKKE